MTPVPRIASSQVPTIYSSEIAKIAVAPAVGVSVPSVASNIRAASDEANLSSTIGLIAQALAQPDSDVRLDKVAALQQAIANGSYSVSASDVAGKMIDSLLK